MPDPSLKTAPRVAAVVVTRNRLALLQECLAALRAQTRKIDEIFVIDNDSDDGTRQYLDAQTDLITIHQGNLGGAGGFHRGIKEAYRAGHDWFWCMDDDTVPQLDALEKLGAAPAFRDASAGFLSSVVRWTDGNLHKMNQVGSLKAHDFSWYNTVLRDKCVPSTTSTFVSILINRRAVAKVGLPLKEFFIWSDDVEYTERISRQSPCFYVLDSVVIHKNPARKKAVCRVSNRPNTGTCDSVYAIRSRFCITQEELSFHWRHIAYFMAHPTYFIVKVGAPMSLTGHLWSGLGFNPRIERVPPDTAS